MTLAELQLKIDAIEPVVVEVLKGTWTVVEAIVVTTVRVIVAVVKAIAGLFVTTPVGTPLPVVATPTAPPQPTEQTIPPTM